MSQPLPGDRAHSSVVASEIAHQLNDVVGELVGVRREVAAHRISRRLVGSGSAAEAQVDAAREERFQGPELLGDDQRRMVGQHDPARADADGRGLRAHEASATAVAALAMPGIE